MNDEVEDGAEQFPVFKVARFSVFSFQSSALPDRELLREL
jgi:hypothetical protein